MSDGGVRKGECEQGGLDRGGKGGGGYSVWKRVHVSLV